MPEECPEDRCDPGGVRGKQVREIMGAQMPDTAVHCEDLPLFKVTWEPVEECEGGSLSYVLGIHCEGCDEDRLQMGPGDMQGNLLGAD